MWSCGFCGRRFVPMPWQPDSCWGWLRRVAGASHLSAWNRWRAGVWRLRGPRVDEALIVVELFASVCLEAPVTGLASGADGV